MCQADVYVRQRAVTRECAAESRIVHLCMVLHVPPILCDVADDLCKGKIKRAARQQDHAWQTRWRRAALAASKAGGEQSWRQQAKLAEAGCEQRHGLIGVAPRHRRRLRRERRGTRPVECPLSSSDRRVARHWWYQGASPDRQRRRRAAAAAATASKARVGETS